MFCTKGKTSVLLPQAPKPGEGAQIQFPKIWEGTLGYIHTCPYTVMLQNAGYCCVNEPMPSVLRRCWLGGRKGIQPVKTEWWGAGMVICLEQGEDLHMAPLTPLPLTVSCFSKIQIGCTFLVPPHPDSPGQRAVKWMCVCVLCQ